MKKYIASVILLVLSIMLISCSKDSMNADYPAAIMVNDVVYYLAVEPMPVEVDESAIIGYTSSYTNTMPKSNGETNFNRELDIPYAEVEGGIAVLYKNEWYLCLPEE